MSSRFFQIVVVLIGAFFTKIIFPVNNFELFGISIFYFISIVLINDIGKTIPIKGLMSFIVFLQLFISPLITYYYFDNQTAFQMHVDREIYMFYILPALMAFSFGLHLNISRINVQEKIQSVSFSIINEKIARWFIVIGLTITIFENITPVSLKFVFYLLIMLKFVGVFILMHAQTRDRWLWLLIVFGHFTLQIIRGGVFYDLFVWFGFLYMLLELQWSSTFFRKLSFIISGLLIVYFVQSIKGEYREQVWVGSDRQVDQKEQVFLEIAANKIEEGNTFSESSNFDRFISRLNTGWIISNVMSHTPHYEPFTRGELLKDDIINVFLPRFLFPDKAQTGGKQNQEKFTRFTGRRLIGNTTMRIGAFSDAYVNFGIVGGWICMLFLGFLFNLILVFMYRLSQKNPAYLYWIPFVFAYAIRMSDIQVILNYTFKSILLMIFINMIFFPKSSGESSEDNSTQLNPSSDLAS